jgi:hypothetical protein
MPISVEQAVEVILQGEGTFLCHLCAGKGITHQIHDVYESCHTCSGSGQVRNPEYDEACEVLGRPKPVIENPAEKAWRDILRSKYVANYSESDAKLSMKNLGLAKAFKVDADFSPNWGKPK